MPRIVRPDGTSLHYTLDAGEGPVVVMLPGIGLGAAHWHAAADAVLRLSQTPRLLRPDPRGTAASPTPTRPFRIADMADDVAAILVAENIERAVVLGVSLGGFVAQELALRHPDRVAGLVLVSTGPGRGQSRRPALRSIALLASVPLHRTVASRQNLYERLFFSTHQPAESRHLAAAVAQRWAHLAPDQRTGGRGYLLQFMAAVRHDTRGRLHRITCPVRVLHGEDDVVQAVENGRALAAAIPGATFEGLPGVGHAVQTECPEAMSEAVRSICFHETTESRAS